MIEIKAPNKYLGLKDKFNVFLAGSIEMGKAIDWQRRVVEYFRKKDLVFLNPRRDDWDSSWQQSIKNKQFREQVTWELEAQSHATIIFMNFCVETKSPITLLELGHGAAGGKDMIVCCPDGFWRKGNVEIVCKRHGIKLYNKLESAMRALSFEYNSWLQPHE